MNVACWLPAGALGVASILCSVPLSFNGHYDLLNTGVLSPLRIIHVISHTCCYYKSSVIQPAAAKDDVDMFVHIMLLGLLSGILSAVLQLSPPITISGLVYVNPQFTQWDVKTFCSEYCFWKGVWSGGFEKSVMLSESVIDQLSIHVHLKSWYLLF